MLKPLLDPDVADVAPDAPILTGYDEERLLTYIRLLDAAAEDADWREVAKIVLHIDPEKEPGRAFRLWETHLARARWMTTNGYRYLLAGGAPHSASRHALLNQHSGLPTFQLPNVRIALDADCKAYGLVRASGEDLAHCKAIGPIRKPTRTCKATCLQSSLPSI